MADYGKFCPFTRETCGPNCKILDPETGQCSFLELSIHLNNLVYTLGDITETLKAMRTEAGR